MKEDLSKNDLRVPKEYLERWLHDKSLGEEFLRNQSAGNLHTTYEFHHAVDECKKAKAKILDHVKDENIAAESTKTVVKPVGWQGVAVCVAVVGIVGGTIWANRVRKQRLEEEPLQRE